MCYESINMEKYCFCTFKKPFIGEVLELLTRAPHGQTINYDDQGQPILENIDKNSFWEWQFDNYLKGVIAFTAQMNAYEKQYPSLTFDSQKIMNFYINYLFNTPDVNLVQMLGELPHKSYGVENTKYAPQIGFGEALKYLFTNQINSENIKFSKIRSSKLVRKMIDFKIKHLF